MVSVERADADTLRREHAKLEGMIKAEYARPHPDDGELKRLKMKKLHIKEALDRLTRH